MKRRQLYISAFNAENFMKYIVKYFSVEYLLLVNVIKVLVIFDISHYCLCLTLMIIFHITQFWDF